MSVGTSPWSLTVNEDDLITLEATLTAAIVAHDRAQRIYDAANELALARRHREMRDRCKLDRARVVEAVTTADRPQTRRARQPVA